MPERPRESLARDGDRPERGDEHGRAALPRGVLATSPATRVADRPWTRGAARAGATRSARAPAVAARRARSCRSRCAPLRGRRRAACHEAPAATGTRASSAARVSCASGLQPARAQRPRRDEAARHRREHPRLQERELGLGQRPPHRRQHRDRLGDARRHPQRAAMRRRRSGASSGAEATSTLAVVESGSRTPSGVGPCTRTPFASAMPPSLIFSSGVTRPPPQRCRPPGVAEPQSSERRGGGTASRARDRRPLPARRPNGRAAPRARRPWRASERSRRRSCRTPRAGSGCR